VGYLSIDSIGLSILALGGKRMAAFCDKEGRHCYWIDDSGCVTEDGQFLCDGHYEQYLQEQEDENDQTNQAM